MIALTEDHWRAVCVALEPPDWFGAPRCADNAARLANRELVHGWIRDVIASDTVDHWVKAISAAGAICVPVREIDDAWSDPRLIERDLLARLAKPGFDSFALPVMSLARCVDADALAPGPRLGQHSAEVLRELGVEDVECAALLHDGVVVHYVD